MNIDRVVLGPLGTNTYFLEIDNKVIVIDPASKPERIVEELKDRELVGVLLTHGHFDHIKAVNGLYDLFKIPILINELDDELARDKYQGRNFNIYNFISCPTVFYKEGIMNIGPFYFEVIFTPGHTEGSVLLKFSEYVFSGDTLFKDSVGRCDLKGGNESKLKQSLNLIKSFDPSLIICPGHGDITVLEDELKNNPYLR